MRKIISFETYRRISEGINNLFDSGLDYRTEKTLRASFNRCLKILFNRDLLDANPIKESIKQNILEDLDYRTAIFKIIVYRYTRNWDLVLEPKRGMRILFRKGICPSEITKEWRELNHR